MQKKGTLRMNCPLIKKELSISVCPVINCMWRHAESGECKYTDKILSVEQYAELTGKVKIDDDQIESIKFKVMERINENSYNQ